MADYIASWAAAVHSSIGNVAGQSLFATLQSAGAGGAGVAVVNTAIQGTGVVIGGAVAATRASMTSVAGNGLEWIRSKL